MSVVKDRSALRVSDPDLPLLASEAAIEIDHLLSGEQSGLAAVESLAERIRRAVPATAAGESARLLLDPATLTVLGEALDEAASGPPMVEMDELVRRAGEIATSLTKRDPQTDRDTLEWARMFCVALSRSAAAYRKSIYDLRPPHPFKRLAFVGS